jgi:hypothetical protein
MAPSKSAVQKVQPLLAVVAVSISIATAAITGVAYVVRLNENIKTLTVTMQTLNTTLEKGIDRINALEKSTAAIDARLTALEKQ